LILVENYYGGPGSVVIIEQGGIVEEGSFNELQAKKGRFFELWESQKL
jgi:ABC-type multidrug transport system fused ATPase/permease subunit